MRHLQLARLCQLWVLPGYAWALPSFLPLLSVYSGQGASGPPLGASLEHHTKITISSTYTFKFYFSVYLIFL